MKLLCQYAENKTLNKLKKTKIFEINHYILSRCLSILKI